MPKKFRIEKRVVFEKSYLKVFLLDKSQSVSVKRILDIASRVRKCNISEEGNLIVYPNPFYSIDEVAIDVENLLVGYLDGSVLLDATKNQCVATLSKLTSYAEAKALYDKALFGIYMGADYRHALDDLRLALETLLKRVLGNEKSMENQGDALGAYLGAKGISSEIVGNVKVNLTAVSRYFNEHEKHKDNVKANEIDYIVVAVNNIVNILL